MSGFTRDNAALLHMTESRCLGLVAESVGRSRRVDENLFTLTWR